jgi:hypothetical protein
MSLSSLGLWRGVRAGPECLAGLNQGINLGENADRMRFAQDRAAQADQQQAFANSQQQIEMDMRRRQVEAAMSDREKRVQEREKERQAIALSMNLVQMDYASYAQAVNANADVLSYAPEGVQRMIGNRSTLQRENKSAQAKYDAAVQAGQKLDADQVQWFKDRGVLVASQHKVRTQREIDEAEDAQDRESLIGMSLARGEIGWEDVPALSRFNNTNMLAARLGMFRQANEAAIQRKQEEQKAAAEQAAQTQSTARIGQLLQKKRAGQPLTPEEEGILATTPGLSEFEVRKPGGGQNPRPEIIDDDLKRVNQDLETIQDDLVRSGVLKTKKVGTRMELTGEIDQDVLRKDSGANQSGPLASRWAQYQQLLATRRRLMSDPSRLSTGGQPTQAQGASPAEQLVNQMEAAGASDQEIAAALRAQGLAR